MERDVKLLTLQQINAIVDSHIKEVLEALKVENLDLDEVYGIARIIKKYVLMDVHKITDEFDEYVLTKIDSDLRNYSKVLRGKCSHMEKILLPF